jgi:biopolymer transport protein TolR
MSEINVVPYIDVMLVLLVIFMVTAPLLQQGIEIDLPQASAQPVPPQDLDPVVVGVDAQGAYYLTIGAGKAEPTDLQSLLTKVAAIIRRNPQTPVLVRGDKAVPYGEVVAAMSYLQQAGVPKVGLMTENPPQASER